MRKKLFGAAIVLAALTLAGPASAANVITFNPQGTGAAGEINVASFDFAEGNSLLQENFGGVDPGHVQVLFQANLGTLQNNNVAVYTNGGGGKYFTAVAGVEADVSAQIPGVVTIFNIDEAAPSFLKLYVNNVGPGIDGAGTCFVCGTEILSAHVVFSPSNGSSFNTTDASGTVALDQSPNGNQSPGVTTIQGNGSTQLTMVIDSFDSNYFTSLVLGQSFTFINTSQILPYASTDPSNFFSSNGVANGDVVGLGSVGTCNGCTFAQGGTFNSLAQVDANASFATPQAVPEPATMTLFGLGLLGSAAARRRQKKNQK